MTRRWIVLTALAVVAFLMASLTVSAFLSRPAHKRIVQPGPLVVVAMPGLTWNDISPNRTPTMWRMAQEGAVGNVVTRAISAHSCSNHAWLTISAGARATKGKGPGESTRGGKVEPCPQLLKPDVLAKGARFPDWQEWRTASLNRPIAADIGLLASNLRARGQCVGAVGQGAAIGAADRSGLVARYSPTVEGARFSDCQINLVSFTQSNDRALGALLQKLPDDTTVVVTGLTDDRRPEQLRAVIVSGPRVPKGLLRSPSTRQPGLLQNADFTAMILSRVESSSAYLPDGRRPVVQPDNDAKESIDYVHDVSDGLLDEHRAVAPFFTVYIIAALVAIGAGLLLFGVRRRATREDPERRSMAQRWFTIIGAGCGSVPVSTFLVGIIPWWKSENPARWLGASILIIAAVVALVAVVGPWRRWVAGPATFIAALTAVVIALDVTHSSPLQFTSIMGLQPVYGGRYYGMGNVGYALYASTALLAAALLAGRWIARGYRKLAAATIVAIGLATIIIDGYPSWGADAGGPLALLPAFGYLALNAAGLRVTWQRILTIGGSTLILVGGLGFLDYLRPREYRTHLGDFVATLIDEGKLTSLQRNISANYNMLTSQWINLFVPVLLVLTLYALIRRDSAIGRPIASLTRRVNFLGHGLAAVTICWLIGFLSNDSGTAIPPSGMIVIIPLVILIAASSGHLAPSDVKPDQQRAYDGSPAPGSPPPSPAPQVASATATTAPPA